MQLDAKYKKAFTLVFEGDLSTFKLNPLTTPTPYGIPYAVALGDKMEELEELHEQVSDHGCDLNLRR